MQLDIFLRTYDGDSVHPRRFDKPKKDIVWRCVRSLCTAIKALPEQPHLTILDDHSTTETVQFLRDETAFLGENITIQTLEGTGNNDSMLAGLTLAKESTADLVYVIEDDYLHYPNALTVALETWEKFRPRCTLPLMAMTLVDCPSNYIDEPDDLEGLPRNDRGDGSAGMIVGGIDRPWRTIGHTGVTFLLEKGVLQKHWEPFNEIARYWPYLEERTTINKLWNTEVGLFGPLVPLSYHLWEDHPFYPVGDLWEQNKKELILEQPTQKNLIEKFDVLTGEENWTALADLARNNTTTFFTGGLPSSTLGSRRMGMLQSILSRKVEVIPHEK